MHRHGEELADPTAYARQQLVRAATGWQQRLRVGDLLGDSSLLAGTTGLPGFTTGAPVDPGPRTELATALAALPPRARAALVLRYGADLTEAATADALGTSVAETREVLLLGLQRLRELVPGDDALDARLRADLTARAADVIADPGQAAASALEGARDRRRHLAGLAAVAGFLVLVVARGGADRLARTRPGPAPQRRDRARCGVVLAQLRAAATSGQVNGSRSAMPTRFRYRTTIPYESTSDVSV